MSLLICNGCGTPITYASAVRLGQKQRGFERIYCNDPDWGLNCWARVLAVYITIFGEEPKDVHGSVHPRGPMVL